MSTTTAPENETAICTEGAPTPEKQHEWLKQYVGEWESEGEVFMGPGNPVGELKGTETTRMVGDFWVMGQIFGGSVGGEMAYQQVYTLGYDPEKKAFVGSVVDNMGTTLWTHHSGISNAEGTKITTFTEGPFPTNPGGVTKFRETSEFKTPDHRVYTSEVEGPDGEWFTFMTINVRRKK